MVRTSAARDRILSTAKSLFYSRGVAAVGVDDIVDASGVAKMTLYHHFKGKEGLLREVLAARQAEFRAWLAAEIEKRSPEPEGRFLALFDALGAWFTTPEFRGCPFLNCAAEVPADAPEDHPAKVAAAAHRDWLRAELTRLARQAEAVSPERIADQALLLVCGAIAEASITRSAAPAVHARQAAEVLLNSQLV